MRFKVHVGHQKLIRARIGPEHMMFDLCSIPMGDGDHWVAEEYDSACDWYVVSGDLPDTEEAQRAVTQLMALAQGHELTQIKREAT